MPRGDEAKMLQKTYIMYNACKGKKNDYKVARKILEQKTLDDLDGIPVLMVTAENEALGYKPNSDGALRRWVQRLYKDKDVLSMLKDFEQRGRSLKLIV